MKAKRFWLMGAAAAGVVLLLILALLPGYFPTAKGAAKLVLVPNGAGAAQIGELLEKEEIIRSGGAFTRYVKLKNAMGKLKAGAYNLKPGMGLGAIVEKLTKGETEALPFTVPEGYTLRKMAAKLEEVQLGKADRFQNLATKGRAQFKELASPPADTLEGYLFPDTYLIEPGLDEAQLITKMLGRMKEILKTDEVAPLLAKSKRPLHEMLILASLVESEAQADEERAVVADVFLNRLKKKMPLESCATVEYVLPERKTVLSYKDTRVESPYNTYLHPGLPPSPICSPGKASIIAALAPAGTDYLFFTARKNGTHYFSHTYAEHLAATKKARNED